MRFETECNYTAKRFSLNIFITSETPVRRSFFEVGRKILKIVYCGDVVGRAGRDAVYNNLSLMRERYRADVIVVNVENAAHGFGVTPGIARDFLDRGADVLTTGNHVWQQREIVPFLDECRQIVRPLNYPETAAGRGATVFELANGKKILITQVLGRVFMDSVDNPAFVLDRLLKNYTLGRNIDAVLVDVHAESTSEKLSLGHYLDGRVSVVAGTHTHIPTADAHILNGGTAYITDVGMCGNYDSVLGFDKQAPIDRLCQRYNGNRLEVCRSNGTVWGIFVETDDKTGLAKSVEQFSLAGGN